MNQIPPSLPITISTSPAWNEVIGMKLIGNGSFKDDSEKTDASLKYVPGLGIVDMIIVSFELPEQIDNYIVRVRKV